MVELWRWVNGYENYYKVSDCGRVRAVARRVPHARCKLKFYPEVVLSPGVMKKGHLYVTLSLHAKPRTYLVHRLVAFAFLGDPDPGHEVCHNDGNPANNHVSNLRWGTASSNNYDLVKHGTHHLARKTHCIRMHLLADPNLIASGKREGYRRCLACSRAREAVPRRSGDALQRLADEQYRRITASAVQCWPGTGLPVTIPAR